MSGDIQGDLFDAGWVDEEHPKYQAHSDTSFAAAEQIKPDASTLRGKIYELLCNSPGMTDEEQQDATGMNPSTQRPRRIELVERGLVRDSGITRETKSGRKAVVWIANP